MTHGIGPRAWQEGYAHPCNWEASFSPLTMVEALQEAASQHPDRPFIDFFGRIYTYCAIIEEARSFASGLQRKGIGKGDRIGLFLPNVPMYVSAYFGILMAGATVVNFSPLYTADELAAQVLDSGTRWLVTLNSPLLLPVAMQVLEQTPLEGLVVGKLASMLPFALGVGLNLLHRKEIAPIPDRLDVLLWKQVLERQPLRPVAIDPLRDLALLQYTGGTTGKPKGAMLTHQNLSANARQMVAIDPHRGERDVVMGVLPLFHIFANACVLNRTVLNGGCIAMLPRFDAEQTLKTLQRVRATAMPGVPTMYQALLDHHEFSRTDFSSLRICVSGGAPLPAPVKTRFDSLTGARLIQGYGLTETSGVVSACAYEGDEHAGTIGHPVPDTYIRLLDKDDPKRDAPKGQPGELAIRGPQVMQGYWGHAQAADAFVERDGVHWLRTGDVGTIDSAGYVRIVDRIKDMIAVGGFKVFPSQVEAVLLRHPAVKECVVIGVPDSYHGEVPAGYVLLHPLEVGEEAVDGEVLRAWVNEQMGKHERLDRVVIRESLPRTMVGKLDRKALRVEIALLEDAAE